MTTVKQYMTSMLNVEKTIAAMLGQDFPRAPQGYRMLNKQLLAIIAVLMKTLTDNGVITDAQLQAVLNAAVADVYDPEPQDGPPL